MVKQKKPSKIKKSPSHKKLKVARERQYGKDFKYYEVFAQIWGWDGYKVESDKAVKHLCSYMRREERKTAQKQRPQDPELQFAVGVAYLSGWIPCENPKKKAAMWFRRSSIQGCDKGAFGVGYIIENGMAGTSTTPMTELDYKNMLEEYTSAAKQGNVYAQYHLANILFEVDPDNPRLIQLLLNAADAGYRPAKDLFDRVCSRRKKTPAREERQVTSSTQKQDLNYDEIKELLLKLLKNSEDTLAIVRRVEASLQMLQTSLNGMWKELRESDAENADKLDELKQMVNNDLQKAASIEYAPVTHKAMKDAEKFMEVLFKNDWRDPARLCDASCDALVTAHVLMKVADTLGIKNYAGIVITAVWALEHECRRRFYRAFDSYLVTIKVPEKERPSRMNLEKDEKGNVKFTLGSAYYVVNPFKLKHVEQFETPSEFDSFANACGFLSAAAQEVKKNKQYPDAGMVFWDYWIPGTEKPGRKKGTNTGKSFTLMIHTLNKNFRKPAAHAQEVTKAEAVECCQLLGIMETRKAHENMETRKAHEKLDDIEGALKTLLWLTAPLE